jgi:CMP-N,N'-diacetyllegionaminic acid synthase
MVNGDYDIQHQEREQMIREQSVLAIVPARGGSKGLPGKNMLTLGGKPMIYWSIKAALDSKYIDDVVITSDLDSILGLAKEMGVKSIFRPALLADDRASMVDVVVHAVNVLKEGGKSYDYLCLLQPTSPLRSFNDIDESFNMMFDKAADSVISVKKQDSSCLKYFVDNGGVISPAAFDDRFPFSRRQDLPNVCSANGAIYIIKVEEFINRKLFVTDSTAAYYMDEENSHDVDTLEDFKLVENLFNDQGSVL